MWKVSFRWFLDFTYKRKTFLQYNLWIKFGGWNFVKTVWMNKEKETHQKFGFNLENKKYLTKIYKIKTIWPKFSNWEHVRVTFARRSDGSERWEPFVRKTSKNGLKGKKKFCHKTFQFFLWGTLGCSTILISTIQIDVVPLYFGSCSTNRTKH
jgi:hypothetical protein